MTHIKKVLVESTGFSSLMEIVSMSFRVEISVVLKLSFAKRIFEVNQKRDLTSFKHFTAPKIKTPGISLFSLLKPNNDKKYLVMLK